MVLDTDTVAEDEGGGMDVIVAEVVLEDEETPEASE